MLRVLIADDDPIIRLDLKMMLEQLDYCVVKRSADGRRSKNDDLLAGDGEEAILMARTFQPDVCIFDVRMPVMDGIEAAGVVCEELISPVILLTAYSDKELVDRAKEGGVFGYLVKPFKPSDLPPAIEMAASRFGQFKDIQAQVTAVRDRLEVRKSVDRAKGIVMKIHSLTEAEAYRRIQLQSMNLRRSIAEVAEAIILADTV
jgi:AmiR/NasT family two-component response regulator